MGQFVSLGESAGRLFAADAVEVDVGLSLALRGGEGRRVPTVADPVR